MMLLSLPKRGSATVGLKRTEKGAPKQRKIYTKALIFRNFRLGFVRKYCMFANSENVSKIN